MMEADKRVAGSILAVAAAAEVDTQVASPGKVALGPGADNTHWQRDTSSLEMGGGGVGAFAPVADAVIARVVVVLGVAGFDAAGVVQRMDSHNLPLHTLGLARAGTLVASPAAALA